MDMKHESDKLKAMFLASLFAGFVFWLLTFHELIIAIFTHGRLPIDILFMLAVIMFYAMGCGLFFGSIMLAVLVKLDWVNYLSVVLSATTISLVIALILFGANTYSFPYTVLALCVSGFCGGIVFCRFTKLRFLEDS